MSKKLFYSPNYHYLELSPDTKVTGLTTA